MNAEMIEFGTLKGLGRKAYNLLKGIWKGRFWVSPCVFSAISQVPFALRRCFYFMGA